MLNISTNQSVNTSFTHSSIHKKLEIILLFSYIPTLQQIILTSIDWLKSKVKFRSVANRRAGSLLWEHCPPSPNCQSKQTPTAGQQRALLNRPFRVVWVAGLLCKMIKEWVCVWVHIYQRLCVVHFPVCVWSSCFCCWMVLCVSVYAPYLCVNMCVGKEDGKTCKRVAIRTTIRKDDCRSNAPVREKKKNEGGWN